VLVVTGGGALTVGGWVWTGAGWVTMRWRGCSEKSRSWGEFRFGGGTGAGAGAGAGAGGDAVVAFCANADGAKAASSAPPPSKLTPYLFIASPDPLRAQESQAPR
jgi:hypothetical protein